MCEAKQPMQLTGLGRPPLGGREPPQSLGGLAHPRHQRIQKLVKRVVDVVFSACGLLVLSPILIMIGALVKLTSRGPVLYRWKVVGQNGRYFTSFKFRSMIAAADSMKEQLLSRNEMSGPVFKMARDPRVTPLGRILRKLSLDELPQFWSVFKGDMSLVGPRPPLQSEWEQFSNWQKKKLSVKPGMTCLWQVSGRNDIKDLDEWVRLDLRYIENWSLWLDLKILLKTIPAVVSGKGR